MAQMIELGLLKPLPTRCQVGHVATWWPQVAPGAQACHLLPPGRDGAQNATRRRMDRSFGSRLSDVTEPSRHCRIIGEVNDKPHPRSKQGSDAYVHACETPR